MICFFFLSLTLGVQCVSYKYSLQTKEQIYFYLLRNATTYKYTKLHDSGEARGKAKGKGHTGVQGQGKVGMEWMLEKNKQE